MTTMTRTLKEVLHDLLQASPVRMKVLAENIGVSYSYLANAGNPDLPDFQFQLRYIIPLIHLTNDYQVLDYIEAACGRVAIPVPNKDIDLDTVSTELCRTIKEFGDMASSTASALADSRISKSEAKNIEQETMELISQAMTFLSAVQSAAK